MKNKIVILNEKERKVNVSGWFAPYQQKRTTLRQVTKTETGVYLIRDSRKKIRYIGFSASNLYKTLYRHFQTQNDRDGRQARTTYAKTGYEIKIIEISGKYAGELEAYLRTKIKPTDDNLKYGLLPDQYYKKSKVRFNVETDDEEEVAPF